MRSLGGGSSDALAGLEFFGQSMFSKFFFLSLGDCNEDE